MLSILALMLSMSDVIAADFVMYFDPDPYSCGTYVNSLNERMDRMTRWAPGDPMCMYKVVDNVHHYAHERLWLLTHGAPAGANIECLGNYTNDIVPCLVDVNNMDFQVVDRVWVNCTTKKHCGHYGKDAGFCCWKIYK